MNRRIANLLLPAIGVACVSVGGCAIRHPDYPSNWSLLEDAARADCLSIGGVYENRGVVQAELPSVLAPQRSDRITRLSRSMFFDERTFRASLRLFEAPESPVDHDLVDSVSLTVTKDGTLEAEGKREGQSLIKRQFFASKGEFHCEGGKIHMARFRAESHGVLVFIGALHSATTIAKANDGSLVIEETGNLVGLALATIPLGGSVSEWSRFQPYEPAVRESSVHPKPKDFVHCAVAGERRWAHWSKCD